MRFSYLSHLECSKCGMTYDANLPQQLCRCGSPLLARYDLEYLVHDIERTSLAGKPSDLWRYHELLPVRNPANIVSLGEGMTPLLKLSRWGSAIGIPNLWLKDEGLNPTGTFKARGAAVGVSRAKELGIQTIVMPTNGNAGGAWSMYAARAGMEIHVVMPVDAPYTARVECAVSNSKLYLVDGLISDAGKVVSQAVAEYGWFDTSTLKEPYRIEGKKTMGFEIVEQLGWNVPDVILYPTGGGVGIIGIYKALQELREVGWIGQKMPRLVAVQASGCAPIVKAWQQGEKESRFWDNANTVAFGINVPKASGDFLVLNAVYDTGGCAVAVDDADILAEQKRLAKCEGVFVCPEGAATAVAARMLRETNWIQEHEQVVLLNTGSGLKYPNLITVDVPTLHAGDSIQ